MPSTDDVIKRLIYQFSSTGADKVAADMGTVNAEQQKLAVSSQQVTKASLDLEQSFDKLERRFDSTIRAQQDYEKVQAKVNAAVAQHPELQARANNVLDLAKQKFDAAKGATDAYSKAVETARGAALGLAAGIGPLGAVLGSFGPWGVAAAAGIGLVSNAMNYMSEHAAKFGDVAQGLKQVADSTDLTITQVRGVTNVASDFGVSAEKAGAALEKFTLNLSEARKGAGPLYDELRAIDSGLADQIATTRDSAAALDILAKAINSTADASQKLAIGKAAFGKGAAGMVGALGDIADAGGVSAVSDALAKATGLTADMLAETAKLQVQIKSLKEENELLAASLYSPDTLKRAKEFEDTQNRILKAATEYVRKSPGSMGFMPTTDEFGQPFNFDLLNQNKAAAAPAAPAVPGPLVPVTSKEQDIAAMSLLANKSRELVTVLGEAATAAEKEQARVDALGVTALKTGMSYDTFTRALNTDTARAAEQVTAIAQAWGNVSESTAVALQTMQNQLPVVQALSAGARMRAQEEATYNDLLLKGKTTEEARALAAKQYELAVAAAHTAAQQTVIASEQNLESIKAQGTGMEGVVAASQAYDNAIRSGASALQASTIYANTLEASLIQADRAAQQLADSTQQAAMNTQLAMTYADRMFSSERAAFGGNTVTPGKQYSSINATGIVMQQTYDLTQSTSDLIAAATASGNIDSAINQLKTAKATTGFGYVPQFNSNATNVFSDFGLKDKGTQDDITNAFLSLYDTKRAQGGDTSAITKQEIADLQAMPQNQTTLDAIANLTKSLNDVTGSTKDLTKSNQDLLSPYYTTDPRTSHIGFRSQGMAAGGYVDVPGGYSANDNMIATIPVASGERIYVDPNSAKRGGGGQSITINAPVAVYGSNANKDDIGRSVYQNAQAAARQISMASR